MFNDEQKKHYKELIAKVKGITLTPGVTNITIEKLFSALERKAGTQKHGATLQQNLENRPEDTIRIFVEEEERHKKYRIKSPNASWATARKKGEVNTKLAREDMDEFRGID